MFLKNQTTAVNPECISFSFKKTDNQIEPVQGLNIVQNATSSKEGEPEKNIQLGLKETPVPSSATSIEKVDSTKKTNLTIGANSNSSSIYQTSSKILEASTATSSTTGSENLQLSILPIKRKNIIKKCFLMYTFIHEPILIKHSSTHKKLLRVFRQVL